MAIGYIKQINMQPHETMNIGVGGLERRVVTRTGRATVEIELEPGADLADLFVDDVICGRKVHIVPAGVVKPQKSAPVPAGDAPQTATEHW